MNTLNDFYVVVDSDDTEWIYQSRPERWRGAWIASNNNGYYCQIAKGTIESIIGHPMTWKDEPVKVELKLK